MLIFQGVEVKNVTPLMKGNDPIGGIHFSTSAVIMGGRGIFS